MPAETLAEILAEAERLEREVKERPAHFAPPIRLSRFYVEHGPRLVAVARAAVEMREAEKDNGQALVPYPYGPFAVHDCTCRATVNGKRASACDCGGDAIDARITASRAAFDAAPAPEVKPDTVEHPCGCYAPDGDACWKHRAPEPSTHAMRKVEVK